MTNCDKCRYRQKCLRILGERKTSGERAPKLELLCAYCGCLSNCCHCALSSFDRHNKKEYKLK